MYRRRDSNTTLRISRKREIWQLMVTVPGNGREWNLSSTLDPVGADIVRLSIIPAVTVPPAGLRFGPGLPGWVEAAGKKMLDNNPATR